ncbi:hypothetical protein GCM10007147_45970 [Nocardiopsis kunsanensis]|uniref:Uncharacterized protein n=1 Tax=Nocardiopsis kunsanensis TaxID=141693 RepID=A0A918XLI1_9ACTN|nr:hypothetical protein [Nocardiopsis kunsanensis]GHD37779.1 hypothetical protein GCM10007147_45970 [Nocardiopsis kunsanensis]
MRLTVDQANSFAAVIFMGSTPKTKFQDRKPVGQDATAEGTPKWQVQVSLAPKQIPGAAVQEKPELINVNVASPDDPGEGLAPGLPVQFDNLAIGTTRDKTIYYMASGLRQQNAAPTAKKDA